MHPADELLEALDKLRVQQKWLANRRERLRVSITQHSVDGVSLALAQLNTAREAVLAAVHNILAIPIDKG